MALDIFNRTAPDWSASFTAESMQLRLAEGLNMLVQSLQLNYAQQINRFYEIGTNYVYLVQGRSRGTVAIQRLVGPRQVSHELYATYGDVCDPQDLQIAIQPGTCVRGTLPGAASDAQEVTYTLGTCIIANMQLNVANAESMVVTDGVQAEFLSLQIAA